MDYQTLRSCDVHPTNIFREREELVGQTVGINYAADQRWYYLHRQTPEEVTLIKIWDSQGDVANRKSFHGLEIEKNLTDCKSVRSLRFSASR